MFVDLTSERCRTCGGQLALCAADDALLTVVCLECGDGYDLESNALHDESLVVEPPTLAEAEP